MNDPILNNLVVQIALAVGLALVGVIAYTLKGVANVGIAYLTAKIGADKVIVLRGFAQTMVRAIEQSP